MRLGIAPADDRDYTAERWLMANRRRDMGMDTSPWNVPRTFRWVGYLCLHVTMLVFSVFLSVLCAMFLSLFILYFVCTFNIK